jgi:exopolyphosphatase/guanosine-5'-triphosphate,3'-diphosphate pyrophosphatase
MQRYAVIDMGTNTFSMIVAEALPDGSFKLLHKDSAFVMLAEDGMDAIGPRPLKRAMEAIAAFKQYLDTLDSYELQAVGTAALRTAANGRDLLDNIYRTYNIETRLVDGKEEARLIHLGVELALPPQDGRFLIMDIGGGSVEFIIADAARVYWADSFPLGIGLLYRKFAYSDPVLPKERAALVSHIAEQLRPLKEQLAQRSVVNLVGASGTFDVLDAYLATSRPTPHCSYMRAEGFHGLYATIAASTIEERKRMAGLRPERLKLIVVSLDLIRYVLELARPEGILVSNYSMREGIMSEMISNNTPGQT